MKLYTKSQLAISAASGALVLFVLLAAVFALRPDLGSRSLAFLSGKSGASGTKAGIGTAAISSAAPAIARGEEYSRDSGGQGVPGASRTQAPSSEAIVGRPVVDTDEQENIDVYERYNEAVVNITTEVIGVNWFLEPVPQAGGSGSGSIIDRRGYVLTNNHVVKEAVKLYVNLSGGARYEAKVIGTDPENDLAIIQFDPPSDRPLKTIPYGSSAGLRVGQKVLAIGNPFGLERTLTQGIISGIGRPVKTDDSTIIRDMIQTDASINPGNSGGPLLNSRGEMVGINAMIYSTSGGSVGIGFAVPVDTAKRIVPDLIAEGKVRRGWIDVQGIQLFPDLIDYMKQNGYKAPVDRGLLVSQVSRGGNADKAGLHGGATPVRYGSTVFNLGGDIIVSVDGMEVASVADLHSALEDNKPGERIAVEYWRGGKRQSTTVALSERRQAETAR
jgi:S1-C subfamily serine protease